MKEVTIQKVNVESWSSKLSQNQSAKPFNQAKHCVPPPPCRPWSSALPLVSINQPLQAFPLSTILMCFESILTYPLGNSARSNV